LLFVEDGPAFQSFYKLLESKLAKIVSAPMLNARIQSAFLSAVKDLDGLMHVSDFNKGETHKVSPALALIEAGTFLTNKKMHEEVFGPFAMIIKCKDQHDMLAALPVLSGQLTITIWSDPSDSRNPEIIDEVENYAGRLVWNGVSTGVEVAAAMVHGGPYPATSNSHFTAVGNAAIYRWLRPVCYQNFPLHLLPVELKN
jgi:NADP-dependent aldehyde dehydrogenase